MVKNIHVRELEVSLSEAGIFIDGLASGSRLWPRDLWPPMVLDRPLGVGASGGHGPIGYVVEAYRPGVSVCFRFTRPEGFIGTHTFYLEEITPKRTRITHVIEMRLKGSARFTWPLFIRWLHDALIEDAFDRAQGFIGSGAAAKRPWSLWVRLLRKLFGGQRKAQKRKV